MKAKELFERKEAILLFALAFAISATLVSVLFPAGVVLSGYYGRISYQGFPVAWTAESAGPNPLGNMYSSLQYQGYVAGFLFDILFWFFIAFIVFKTDLIGKIVGASK